jgi:DTW domain-containing protein YfiP
MISQDKRKICNRCCYPQTTCLCEWIKPFSSPLKLVVLQHPKEAKHAKNTVKLLQLGITNIQVIVGEIPEDFRTIQQQINQNPERFSLCYPCEQSTAIEQVRKNKVNAEHTMIFIDASWRKALKMWHLNPWLHPLKTFHFATPPANQYAIRKTSVKNGLSTLEAVAYVLSCTHSIHCEDLMTLYLKMQSERFKYKNDLLR